MGDNNIIYHLLFKTNLNLIKNFVTGNRADAVLTRIVHAGPYTAALGVVCGGVLPENESILSCSGPVPDQLIWSGNDGCN